ncbi:MAG TPA: hypothetical protein VE646_05630 [Actinomycetota bacterium]|jgi:hypothetical protein|nr:hypothetical protein [Actinomycetota bacterium]
MDHEGPERGSGLREEVPRAGALGTATALGGLWGLLGYTVLWDGTPFATDRRFVESVLGTMALLPIRLVLWGIRAFELLTGRTYNFPDSNWWIGAVAGLLGALIVAGGVLAIRTTARWVRSLGA